MLVISIARGGSLVGSMLAFYSDDPSSDPAEEYIIFLHKNYLETTKNKLRGQES